MDNSNALIRRETVVLVSDEDAVAITLLKVMQTILYGLVLVLLVACLTVAGVILAPFLFLVGILDFYSNKDKYASANREKPQD